MERIPDWAGTEPANVSDFMSRLPTRVGRIVTPLVKTLDDARKLKHDLSMSLSFGGTSHIAGLGRSSLSQVEMALGSFDPPESDLDTSDCWMCNGKMRLSPHYCARHCEELNAMRGSWRKVWSPKGLKGRARNDHRGELTAKAINRWLRKHRPTILGEKDAQMYMDKFEKLVASKEWKRRYYAFAWRHAGYFFHEGNGRSVGKIWVNGERVNILPEGAIHAMRKLRSAADRAGKGA